MNSKCSKGKLSCCFYNRAKTDSIIPGSHRSIKTKLSEVVAKIMPMYQLLTLNEISLCCVSGKTQNVNESLHSCTWRKCPKKMHESKNGTVGTALKKLPTDAIIGGCCKEKAKEL
ncbi:uncharacterized protein TNCV_5126641 [Trichonephila clavipes]|nr:uncharacterized protein TNCV_5126641 [Trichonephila clavipes]